MIYEVEGYADSAGNLHPDGGRPSDVESTTGVLVHAYEPDRNGEPKEGSEHWFWEFYPEGSTWDEIDTWVDLDYGEYEHAQA